MFFEQSLKYPLLFLVLPKNLFFPSLPPAMLVCVCVCVCVCECVCVFSTWGCQGFCSILNGFLPFPAFLSLLFLRPPLSTSLSLPFLSPYPLLSVAAVSACLPSPFTHHFACLVLVLSSV